MSVARKILSNTVAQLAGKLVTAILGLAVVKIATSYLSVEGYGEYVLVYEFLTFFGIAADLGLFTIAVQQMSKDEENIPKIIGNVLSLRTILVILTLLAAIGVSFAIPAYQDTKIPLGVTIASLTVFFTILNGTITSVLQTKLRMEIASLTTILGKVISVGFMLYIVFWGFPTDTNTGFYLLMAAGVVGNFVMLLATHHYVKKITPLEYRFDFDIWKNVFKKSLPYGIALILNAVYFKMDAILISLMRGQQELGIYGVPLKILEQFVIIPLYFMNAVLPVLTKAINSEKDVSEEEKSKENYSPKYQEVIYHSFNFLSALAVPLVVGGIILAYPVIFVVSTPEFLSRLSEGFIGSDIALQIILIALLFQFVNVLFVFILIAIEKQTKLLYINGIGVAFNLITNLIFIPIYGFLAAAVTTVISELIILVGAYMVAKKHLKFSIKFGKLFKIILSAGVMGLLVKVLHMPTYNLMQNWNIIPLVAMGMIVYTIMLFATGAVDKKMLNLLRKRV
jgi:O-antigen/teichoic acid export membrane protein